MSPKRLSLLSSTLCFFILMHSAKPQDPGNGSNNNYGDGSIISPPAAPCTNCTICEYPCHPQAPPPPDAAATQPPPGQLNNCPPAATVVCCGGQNYAPPTPFYYPYNNYSGAAPLIQPGSCVSTWPYVILLGYYIVLLICC